ncbi:hypothetical protein I352_05586 [Cryptococcus deuterogattii MMRL2647]|nr:hypothetical protein I352_05586 [Cryptococcus deuterogattii MMRL2647]
MAVFSYILGLSLRQLLLLQVRFFSPIYSPILNINVLGIPSITAATLLTVLTVQPALRAAELLQTPTLAAVLTALPADLAPPTAGPS